MKNLLYPFAALALLASGNAFAQNTSTANINVTATVEAACQDVTASDVDFGADSNNGGTDSATSTITVECDTGTPYTVEIDYGVDPAGVTQRRVSTGVGDYMDYAIYQDAGSTTPWGTLAETEQFDGTGTGAADALTAYFVLTRAAGAALGTYTDLVVVTLTY